MVSDLLSSLILADGWKRALLALSCGFLSVLAMPPFDAFYVLWLTLPVMILLTDGTTSSGFRLRALFGDAFRTGWWFGLGYFTAGLYWIGHAFLVESEKFALLMPLAVLVLPAVLAVFYGLAFWLARTLWCPGACRLIVLALALSFMEWLRSFLFTGFPWNPLGMALTFSSASMQTAHIIGLTGLNFLAVLIFASPVLLAEQMRRRTFPLLFLSSIVVFAANYAYGVYRLSERDQTYHETMSLRLVQPNIAQIDKWNPDKREDNFNTLLDLSASNQNPDDLGLLSTTHLIWPETAVPFLLTREPSALATIGKMLPLGSVLMTGAIRTRDFADQSEPLFYNSLQILDENGAFLQSLDKVRLVPFGEFVPFAAWLEKLGFEKLTEFKGSFGKGSQLQSVTLPGTPPFLSLICYEIIFPHLIVGVEPRPQWMVNVTNDAWFGHSTGPYQHLRQAQIRAVETGLPVVRAANTGISAVINPWGNLLHHLDLGERGIIQSALPQALPPTFYASYPWLMPALFGLALVLAGFKSRRKAL
jgi:apolipoprotein N-acyltransferase